MRHRGKRNGYIGSLCLLVVSCLVSSFLFKPPVKIRAEELNQYVYARNNPATYTDPGGNIAIVPAAVFALVFVVGGMVLTVKVRGDYLMSKEGKELLDSANQVIYKGKTYLAKQFKKLVTWTGKAVKKGIKALDKAVASVISWIKKQVGKGKEKGEEKKKGKEKKKDKGESETSEREYKTKKKVKGKQKDDIPERFRGEKPYKGESGKDAAKRILQEYGEYDPNRTGPGTIFNQLKKYFDTHFE